MDDELRLAKETLEKLDRAEPVSDEALERTSAVLGSLESFFGSSERSMRLWLALTKHTVDEILFARGLSAANRFAKLA